MTGKEADTVFLPDWLEKGIESSLRDTEDDTPPMLAQAHVGVAPRAITSSTRATPVVLSPSSGPSPAGSYVRQEDGKTAWTDLDQFYADVNDEDTDNESDETEDASENEEATTEPDDSAEGDTDEDEYDNKS